MGQEERVESASSVHGCFCSNCNVMEKFVLPAAKCRERVCHNKQRGGGEPSDISKTERKPCPHAGPEGPFTRRNIRTSRWWGGEGMGRGRGRDVLTAALEPRSHAEAKTVNP